MKPPMTRGFQDAVAPAVEPDRRHPSPCPLSESPQIAAAPEASPLLLLKVAAGETRRFLTRTPPPLVHAHTCGEEAELTGAVSSSDAEHWLHRGFVSAVVAPTARARLATLWRRCLSADPPAFVLPCEIFGEAGVVVICSRQLLREAPPGPGPKQKEPFGKGRSKVLSASEVGEKRSGGRGGVFRLFLGGDEGA